ncbi:MAG: hypothetical protein ACI8UO_001130 [Verrucomicrobiales bacterium]|jgi:hypothetical protein
MRIRFGSWVAALIALSVSFGVSQEPQPERPEINLENLRRAKELLKENGIDPSEIKLRGGEIELPDSANPAAAGEEGEPEEPAVIYEIPKLPQDIADPEIVPPYLLLICVGIGVTLVLGAGVFVAILMFKRKRSEGPAPPPLLPPLPEAMTSLSRLFRALDETDPVEIARQVSDILKRYTDRRFGVHFQEKTTEEIQNTTPNWTQQLPTVLAEVIVPFLNRGDMIKFMGAQDIEMEKRQLIDEAKVLIERADKQAVEDALEATRKEGAQPQPKRKRPATA